MVKQCPVFQVIQAFLGAKCALSEMNAEKVINIEKTLRDERLSRLSYSVI